MIEEDRCKESDVCLTVLSLLHLHFLNLEQPSPHIDVLKLSVRTSGRVSKGDLSHLGPTTAGQLDLSFPGLSIPTSRVEDLE